VTRILTLLCFIIFHLDLQAEQLTFSKVVDKKKIHMEYQWIDHEETPQSLDFSLPKSTVNKQVHRKFIPDIAQQYVYIELHKAARKIDPREARVEIKHHADDLRVTVNSRSPKLLQKWQDSMQISQERAFDQYLQDNYYSHFSTHVGQKGVKPDHLRYIAESKAALLPLAQAVYDKLPEGSDTRAYVNLMLSWVQSIPYNALESRIESNGAGYLPPITVVANNQGDCDSKSTLMATLIRTLLPDVKMIMLYLPNHALLGISLPFRIHEQTFELDGTDYLLMEPTGPAAMKLGTTATRSSMDIASGMYSYEYIP
jgi:hypothetical protein